MVGQIKKTTLLPETNSQFAPENGWLKDEFSFGNAPFSRGYATVFSGRVRSINRYQFLQMIQIEENDEKGVGNYIGMLFSFPFVFLNLQHASGRGKYPNSRHLTWLWFSSISSWESLDIEIAMVDREHPT